MDQPEAGTSPARADQADRTRPYQQTVPADHFTADGVEPVQAPPVGDGWPRLNGINVTRRLRRDGKALTDGDARFQVEALLGVGATGEVYSVRDRNLHRQVAIKVLSRSLIDDGDHVSGFVDEARITASLQHPNVLPVHEIDVTEEGQPYFSMSRIEGSSLGTVIAQSTRDQRHPKLATTNAVVSTVIAVCHAISYAHHQKLVHQDIKPDNIMLGDFGEVLVLDWGSAVRMDAAGQVRTRIYGTPLYMSPEQARQEHSDATSDVYCIGATLFHALTLRLPTWSDDPEAFWNMKRRGDIAPPNAAEREGVPTELIEIALKAMAADPAQRYPTVDALLRDLERYQAGLAVSVHRDSLWRRFRRWHRQNVKVFWVSVTAALLVAAALSVVVVDKIKERTVWRKVYAEDFSGSAESLASHWIGRIRPDGNNTPFFDAPLTDQDFFAVRDGALHVFTDRPLEKLANRKPIVDIAYAAGLRGNIRVEWDYSSVATNLNFNCFIGGKHREDGFAFHVGGFGDPSCVVLTKGDAYLHLVHDILPSPLAVGRVYRFTMEREDRHVRLYMDGHRVVDYVDAEDFGSAIEQSFGFDSYIDSHLVIDNVTVFHQSLAQRISPIQVGDRFFQLQQYEEAAKQYNEIAGSYPGTDLRPQALFKLGICSSRQKHREDAERELDAFEEEYPGHELVPFSTYERLSLARSVGDAGNVARIRSEMKAFKGHPILRQVLLEMGQEQVPMLKAMEPAVLGEEFYPLDIVQRIQDRYAELGQWARDYGTSLDKNPFMIVAPAVLQRFGSYNFILEHCADQRQTLARVLLRMGRFEEVLSRFPEDLTHRAKALTLLGRYDEVVALPGADIAEVDWARFLAGDIAGLERDRSDSSTVRWMKCRTGRAAEVVDAIPAPESELSYGVTQRVDALLACGRAEEVLREYRHPYARSRALIALKRYEEALALSPGDFVGCEMAALGTFIDHDLERWRQVDGILGRLHVSFDEDDIEFSHFVMPALLRAIAGDRMDPRKEFAHVLANMRGTFCQRLWHQAAFIVGVLDERGFLAQPDRGILDGRLLAAKAYRADLRGERAQALDYYRQHDALPAWKWGGSQCERMFRAWRIQVLASDAGP